MPNNLVNNETISQTYVLDGTVLGEVSPDLVVKQYPLVKGDYQMLTSQDNFESWKTNFLVAFVTAIINFVCKLVAYSYFEAQPKSKPETWEILLILITFLGFLICFLVNKFCDSPKKRLKQSIENRIG